jgi:hypothetical protein
MFERACNLVNSEGEILALVTYERGLNPFAVLLTSIDFAQLGDLKAGDMVNVREERLEIGDWRLEWGEAKIWNPVPDWEVVREFLGERGEVLDELLAVARLEAPEGSLLDLTPQPLARLLTRKNASGEGELRQEAFFKRARGGAEALVTGLRDGKREQCLEGARLLAGVGGGLTPAGDDFIVGVLLASWAGGQTQGLPLQEIAEAVAPLTTTLSAAYVRAAARGECAIYWHRLFEAMVSKYDWSAEIRDLVNVGHTSGADALAGFVATRIWRGERRL